MGSPILQVQHLFVTAGRELIFLVVTGFFNWTSSTGINRDVRVIDGSPVKRTAVVGEVSVPRRSGIFLRLGSTGPSWRPTPYIFRVTSIIPYR